MVLGPLLPTSVRSSARLEVERTVTGWRAIRPYSAKGSRRC
ncbi:MAG: hypothetical protein AVDCRST_MAG59-490 [uncultured Thermomicrobiales bacterium]|uniref:Uncharacterized protein n=1 Tax=uncultured Thermomicrobiales bacterium TaxID=1645740 RepID=A0A6J4U3W6_9BACT|nr:MAG: hypothetical protein AVDCRST_MAG59-490 [uncultured Thermomicrobiales bacterium]